jgi:hypothetical protein
VRARREFSQRSPPAMLHAGGKHNSGEGQSALQLFALQDTPQQGGVLRRADDLPRYKLAQIDVALMLTLMPPVLKWQ